MSKVAGKIRKRNNNSKEASAVDDTKAFMRGATDYVRLKLHGKCL